MRRIAICLLIVVVILVSTWGLLRDSMNYAMDAVPADIDLPALRDCLQAQDKVCRIHDLHAWPLSTSETALTVHLVVTDGALDNRLLGDLQQQLHDRFRIAHSTIQVETGLEGGVPAGRLSRGRVERHPGLARHAVGTARHRVPCSAGSGRGQALISLTSNQVAIRYPVARDPVT